MHHPLMMERLAPHKMLRFSSIEQEPSKWNYSSRVIYDGEELPAKPLTFGAAMLAAFGLDDKWLDESHGRIRRSRCQISQIRNALVCSSSGIIGLTKGVAIRDTLDHTRPNVDGYSIVNDMTIGLPEPSVHLRGRYLSLLLGGQDNHFHWLLMNFSRLGVLENDELSNLNGILIPDCLSDTQEQLITISELGKLAPLIKVPRGLSLRVDTLILPWNIASDRAIAPRAVEFLRGLLPDCEKQDRVIYVDRRKSARRPLINEPELVEALKKFGIVPVRFEEMPMLDQARLCREAKIIIGPHGAGLANVAFCKPGSILLELMPKSNENWTYRYLAASAALRYDCIIGHDLPSSPKLPPTFRGPWVISVPHVLAAVEALTAALPISSCAH